jgi:hypothetical protein
MKLFSKVENWQDIVRVGDVVVMVYNTKKTTETDSDLNTMLVLFVSGKAKFNLFNIMLKHTFITVIIFYNAYKYLSLHIRIFVKYIKYHLLIFI